MRALRILFRIVVGLFAVLGVATLLVAVALGVAWQRLEEWRGVEAEVPKSVVLTLDLADGVSEAAPSGPLARASGGAVELRDVVTALEAGAEDPRVKGFVARVGRGGLGMAQTQALRAAVRRFHDSGKPAFAFAEDFGQGAGATRHAYLASAFDQVWLQPSGNWGATGFLLQTPFLGEALDKLGVVPRFDQRKEYKGIADKFTDTRMPAAQRRNLQRLLDSWLSQVVTGVAEGRGIAETEVRRLIDQAPLSAGEAKAAALVDRLGYRDEVAEAARRAAGAPDAEHLPVADYEARRERDQADGPVIAVVQGLGPVVLGESEPAPVFGRAAMGSDTLAPAILDALDTETVAAIVLRVDSPGGSYVASDTIWRAVKKAGEAGKPVVVSMGDMAASGGYFVAAPAEAIVAQPGTVTGSIGVASGKFVMSGLWDKLGVSFDGVQAGRSADIWSPNSDFSEAQWDAFQEQLDRTYADFTSKVAEGRGLDAEQVAAAAGGRVWSGADAKEMGLVDHLGGFRRAVEVAKEAAGIAAETRVRLRPFPEPESPVRALLRELAAGRLAGLDPATVRRLARAAEVLAPVVDALAPLAGDPRAQPLRARDVETLR